MHAHRPQDRIDVTDNNKFVHTVDEQINITSQQDDIYSTSD